MPKKTVSKTETEMVTSAPVVDVAPATEKKTRKPKAVKTEAAVESAPVTTPVVEAAPATTDAAPAADTEASLVEQSNEFVAKLQQLGSLIASLKSEYKALEKKWSREVKTAKSNHLSARERLETVLLLVLLSPPRFLTNLLPSLVRKRVLKWLALMLLVKSTLTSALTSSKTPPMAARSIPTRSLLLFLSLRPLMSLPTLTSKSICLLTSPRLPRKAPLLKCDCSDK